MDYNISSHAHLRERSFYVDQLIAVLNTPVIKVITGMRRVGKSSIMQSMRARMIRDGQIDPHQILFIDKELPEFFHIRTGDDLYTCI